MHPIAAHQVGKSIVDDRVKRAEIVRMARQAREARMPERSKAHDVAPGKAGKLLADAGEWIKTRITPASA
jgi:hypothetical protein